MELMGNNWSQCSHKFSEDGVNNMFLWLINAKKAVETSSEKFPNFDVSLLNSSQRKAYEFVTKNFRNGQELLQMIIKGLSGSKKSYY